MKANDNRKSCQDIGEVPPRGVQSDPTSGNLAWCGWSLDLPAQWRPLKIEGTFKKGTMFIGDSESPYVMVQWWRPKQDRHKTFNIDEWLTYRFKKLHAMPQADAPKPACFDVTAWVRDLQTREGHSRTVWYGYASAAETVIEVIMTSLTPTAIRKQVVDEVIPSLNVGGMDAPLPWSIFTISFVSPGGFMLDSHQLLSGDAALQLKRGTESLLVRTVYPAKLAIERRSLEEWLKAPPFLERRKNKQASTCAWTSESGKREGIIRKGWKRLPAPLGFVKPRYSSAVAAVDPRLDRLLIAEHQTPKVGEPILAENAIEQMSWD